MVKVHSSQICSELLRRYGIEFHPVERQKENNSPKFMESGITKNKTSPDHTSLLLFDRVIRSIRDMAYKLQVRLITPKVILDEYNNACHSILTKYADFTVTPMIAHKDKRFEDMIATK